MERESPSEPCEIFFTNIYTWNVFVHAGYLVCWRILKSRLLRNRYSGIPELRRALHEIIADFNKTWYRNVFSAWIHRHQRCILCQGDFIESCSKFYDICACCRCETLTRSRFGRRLCNPGVLRVEFIVFAFSYIDYIFVMILLWFFQILFMRYRAISY